LIRLARLGCGVPIQPASTPQPSLANLIKQFRS
jgi:hypothetical protein